jgi:hypothetical protein
VKKAEVLRRVVGDVALASARHPNHHQASRFDASRHEGEDKEDKEDE